MKKVKYLLFFFFLSNCQQLPYGSGTAYDMYNQFQKTHSNYPYHSLVCSKSDLGGTKGLCTMGSAFTQIEVNNRLLNTCSQKNSDCVVVKENNTLVYSQQKNQIDSYISQCEYIGFKRNTEKMGECVLKISQTETKIVNNSGGNDNTLANLIILQESLKVLNPPVQPNRNIKCIFNKVGGIGGVNCF